jgi:hypothetical protein
VNPVAPTTNAEPVPRHGPVLSAIAFWPVLAWLALQMLALLAAVMRVPFSARFPVLGERLAVHEMIVVQIVGAALLFPVLFRTFATGVVVVACAPVMVQLAGVLAAARFEPQIALCAYPALWLIGLGLWSSALRTERARLYGVAAATLVSLGGAILTYLAREAVGAGLTFDWAAHGQLGPLTGAVTLLEVGERTGTPWAFMGIFVTTGAIAALAAGLVRAKRAKYGKNGAPSPTFSHANARDRLSTE